MSNKEDHYISEVKNFIQSDTWKEYLLPLLNASVQKELPKPNEKGWQERYIYAHALASAFAMFINSMTNLAGKKEFKKEVEKYLNASIDEA